MKLVSSDPLDPYPKFASDRPCDVSSLCMRAFAKEIMETANSLDKCYASRCTTQEEERFTRKQGSKCGGKTEKPNHWAPSSARVPNAANFVGFGKRLPFRTLTFSPSHGRPGYLTTKMLISRKRKCLQMRKTCH